MTTAAAAPRDVVVAELERRVPAFVLDLLLAWSLALGAAVVAWSAGAGVCSAAGAAAATLLVAGLGLAALLGVRGATPGKAACGLRVVDATTGTPIGVGRALLRQLVLGVGTVPLLGLGTAALAWTAAEDRSRARRGWHDHLVGSVVVDVRAPAGPEEVPAEGPRQVVNLTALRLVPPSQGDAPTPAASPAAPTTQVPGAPPPSSRRTTWRVTADTGETLLVEGVVLVGRDPEPRAGEQVARLVPLRSADLSLSRTHAGFHVARDGALVVTDRGSTNGSVLVRQGMSRALVVARPATLLDGDRVEIGDREIRVAREVDRPSSNERRPQWR